MSAKTITLNNQTLFKKLRVLQHRLKSSALDTVEKIVDLGFLIKGDLSFDDHCKAIALRANRLTYNIFRALSTNNPIVLIKAFKTYVRLILEHCRF